MPATTAASRALASGTASAMRPDSRAASAADSAPRTGRMLPSRESSPRNIILLMGLPKNWPMQPARPSAMRRSNAEPSFLTVGGSEIYCDALTVWEFDAAIAKVRFDSLTALFHGVIRQTDNVE